MSVGSVLAAPAAAYVSAQPAAAGVTDMGAGRIGAITAALLGLTAVAVGALALARATGRTRAGRIGHGRGGAVAVAAGLAALALGGLVAATADGGLGSGNGLGGAYVALIVGLTGTTLGALSLARSRRTHPSV
ncbi:DUF6223 family protein [Embleya sp. NPDC050154]|uniref:DUF6223 family protein n=1 Tax=Embleya sp. NPDC050154 TaxID=3363988 RepID=UPI0037AE941F